MQCGARQVQCGARQVLCGARQVQDFFLRAKLEPFIHQPGHIQGGSFQGGAFQVEPFKLGLSYSSGARQVQCGARQVQCGVRQVQDFFFNSNLTPSAFF